MLHYSLSSSSLVVIPTQSSADRRWMFMLRATEERLASTSSEDSLMSIDPADCLPMEVQLLCPICHDLFFGDGVVEFAFVKATDLGTGYVQGPAFVAKCCSFGGMLGLKKVVPKGLGYVVYKNIGLCPFVKILVLKMVILMTFNPLSADSDRKCFDLLSNVMKHVKISLGWGEGPVARCLDKGLVTVETNRNGSGVDIVDLANAVYQS
jgi:hypothetical protein